MPVRRIPTTLVAATLLLPALLAAAPKQARAQGVLPALAGAAGGAVAGGVVTAGWLAVQATREVYLWSPGDLADRYLLPPLLGTVAGAVQGSTDADALWAGMAAGAGAGLLGAGAGYLAGAILGSSDRARWQGLLIGGALGVVSGWVAGSLLHDDGSGGGGGTAAPTLVARFPVGLPGR